MNREQMRMIGLMQREHQQKAFRDKQSSRRSGKRMEVLQDGKWILDTEYASVNAAKRASRGLNHYTL
jgi:hypothetical protein